MVREAAKKVLLLMIKGRAIKEKGTFFGTFLPNVPKFQRPLSSRGEGGKALMARPLREYLFFCGFPKCMVWIFFSLTNEMNPTQSADLYHWFTNLISHKLNNLRNLNIYILNRKIPLSLQLPPNPFETFSGFWTWFFSEGLANQPGVQTVG